MASIVIEHGAKSAKPIVKIVKQNGLRPLHGILAIIVYGTPEQIKHLQANPELDSRYRVTIDWQANKPQ